MKIQIQWYFLIILGFKEIIIVKHSIIYYLQLLFMTRP